MSKNVLEQQRSYDGYIEAISKDDAEDLLKIIYERMKEKKNSSHIIRN